MSSTDTVASAPLVTNTRRLSSEKASSWCPAPVGIFATTSRVRASSTVTPLSAGSSASFPTHRYLPSGWNATRTGRTPAGTSRRTLKVSRSTSATRFAPGSLTRSRVASGLSTQSSPGDWRKAMA